MTFYRIWNLFISTTFFFIIHTSIVAIAEFSTNLDSCWDLGFTDFLPSKEACKRTCELLPKCKSFGYNINRNDKRCHLCTWTSSRAEIDCPNGEVCSYWGRIDGNVSPASIRDSAISVASDFCNGKIIPSADLALAAAIDLNMIIKNIGKGLYTNDATFSDTHGAALDAAVSTLASEDDNCFKVVGPYSDQGSPCTHGGVLFLQLRALLLLEDDNTKRAFPMPRDEMRASIFDKHKVLVVDNGWFTDDSLKAVNYFFDELPPRLMSEGVTWDTPFAIMSAKDAFICESDRGATDVLGFTNRGFNVFKVQLHQGVESGFPNDTPDKPAPADLLMTVLRHEAGHQFDRVMSRDQRMKDMFQTIISLCETDDDWLRGMNDFFHSANQEIMASQIGNQYLDSTSAQLRLAAQRLHRGNPFTIKQGLACYGEHNLGTSFSSPDQCAAAALENPDCSGHEIMWSTNYNYAWGCRCCMIHKECESDEDRYYTNPNWSVYQISHMKHVPCDHEAILDVEGHSCAATDKNLGTAFNDRYECAAAAIADPDCSGHQIMWSGYSYAWGCYCCKKPTCDDNNYNENINWSIYKYRNINPCPNRRALKDDKHYLETFDTASNNGNQVTNGNHNMLTKTQLRATTTTKKETDMHITHRDLTITYDLNTPSKDKHTCAYNHNLGSTFKNRQECAAAALQHPSCTGHEIMWSPYSYAWGCKCCSVAPKCRTDEQLFSPHDLWSLYQYRDTVAQEPCSGTKLALAWFLFNLDFMSGGENTVDFYEDGDFGQRDGYAVPVCAKLRRDSLSRIISADIPGCGVVNFAYGRDDDIVTSVDQSAINCRVDPNATPAC